MALVIQPGKSPYWYARIEVRPGQTICPSLKIKIEGRPPMRLSELGDVLFERSRARAQLAYEKLVAEIKAPHREQQLLEKIYRAKTQKQGVPTIRLDAMSEKWEAAETRNARYVSVVRKMHGEFIEFLREHAPTAETMADVTHEHAKKFMDGIRGENFAPATFNRKLDALRSTFNCLARGAGVVANPFGDIAMLEADFINRVPFPVEELDRILEVARRPEHALIYPALVVASMTAMREGDCCRLAWASVDQHLKTVRVKLGKTKKTITIPMAPRLAELVAQTAKTDSPFLFPKLADFYHRNPTAITDLTRSVLRDAGYFDLIDGGPTPIAPVTAARADGTGKRRVSIRDFHSFRASWVTVAINSGVPIELVCRVTGHRSLDTLQKHYFLPSLEDLRRVLSDKLPPALGGKPAAEHDGSELRDSLVAIRAKLDLMSPRNWARVRDQIAAVIDTALQPPKRAA